jgi:hypothetical protein
MPTPLSGSLGSPEGLNPVPASSLLLAKEALQRPHFGLGFQASPVDGEFWSRPWASSFSAPRRRTFPARLGQQGRRLALTRSRIHDSLGLAWALTTRLAAAGAGGLPPVAAALFVGLC